MSKDKSGISKTVRGYRQEREMSQEALARAANLSFPTIVKIESGETPNPTINTVKKITDALDVSVDKLLQ